MTIINELIESSEVDRYSDIFYEISRYLGYKGNHLDMLKADSDYATKDNFYVHNMELIWDDLPDWAKDLLTKEIG